MAAETAGDPMSTQKWVRSSLRQLSRRLREAGHPISPPTVGRLLKSWDYALQVNAKKVEAGAGHPERDTQFAHIMAQRQAFTEAGDPIISVDTKKKELIGNVKNAGATWRREAEAVNVHDFLQEAVGRAVPYGIYDVTHNRGTVYVGSSADTPQFAVDVLARWWDTTGRATYPQATKLLILADGGGSNASRSRVWKQQIQEQLCDGRGLTVTVCHYPPGCSKWNPVEHRLFGPISVNWAGRPLRTFATHARLPARHHDHHRLDGRGRLPRGRLCHRPGRLRRRDGHAQSGAPCHLSDMELYPPSALCRRRHRPAKTGTYCLTRP